MSRLSPHCQNKGFHIASNRLQLDLTASQLPHENPSTQRQTTTSKVHRVFPIKQLDAKVVHRLQRWLFFSPLLNKHFWQKSPLQNRTNCLFNRQHRFIMKNIQRDSKKQGPGPDAASSSMSHWCQDGSCSNHMRFYPPDINWGQISILQQGERPRKRLTTGRRAVGFNFSTWLPKSPFKIIRLDSVCQLTLYQTDQFM